MSTRQSAVGVLTHAQEYVIRRKGPHYGHLFGPWLPLPLMNCNCTGHADSVDVCYTSHVCQQGVG